MEEEEKELKQLRKNLKKTINRTKKVKWKELCEELEKDVWGQGYQIAMRSLQANKLPYSLPKEQKKKIVEDLFPRTQDTRERRVKVNGKDIPPFRN